MGVNPRTICRISKVRTIEHDEQVALFRWAEVAQYQHPELALLYAIPKRWPPAQGGGGEAESGGGAQGGAGYLPAGAPGPLAWFVHRDEDADGHRQARAEAVACGLA